MPGDLKGECLQMLSVVPSKLVLTGFCSFHMPLGYRYICRRYKTCQLFSEQVVKPYCHAPAIILRNTSLLYTTFREIITINEHTGF